MMTTPDVRSVRVKILRPIQLTVVLALVLVGCTSVEPTTDLGADIQAEPQVASIPSAAEASTPVPDIDVPSVSDVVGWTESRVSDVLGPANLVRQDLRAQIWRYTHETCQLLVFLYEEAGDDVVRHVQADAGKDTGACLGEIVRAHHTPKPS